MKEMLFLIFLAVAAWQDMRDKEIDAWLYVVFGGLIWFGKLCFDGPVELWREAVNAVPGIALALLSRLSGGAVGEGDGWFFVVAGVALEVWNAVALFFISLFLCCLWCAGMAVWGWRRRISVRRKTVPFLPFVLPAVLWILRG